MTGGLAWEFTGGPLAPVIVGSLLSAASMLLFLATVIRHGFGAGRGPARAAARLAGRPPPPESRPGPALPGPDRCPTPARPSDPRR